MLNKAIMANAIFSSTSGIGILLARDWFAQQIPGPDWLILVISVGLLIFSVQLLLMATVKLLAKKLILQVVFSDIGWVLLTTAGLIGYLDRFSTTGIWLVILINVMVAFLAWLQFTAYRKEYVLI